MSENKNTTFDEIVVGENELVCSLTNKVVKATDKERTLQDMISMLTEEYGFPSEDIERDFRVKYEDVDTGNSKTQRVDLAVFEEGRAHVSENLIRFVIVA